MDRLFIIIFCGFFGMISESVFASESIGYVKTVSGDAFVISDGKSINAVSGTSIQLGSVIKTAANGSLGMTLKDNTLLSFGPSTEFTIEDYLFAPGKGSLKLGCRIAGGTLNYVSGAIAKLKPDAVTLRTPTGTIGVRGTHFVLKVN